MPLPGSLFSVGSGSTFAYGVLDTGYRYDLNFDEVAAQQWGYHEGWLEWLLKDKYHAGGHWDYHEHFRQADEDHSSTLDYDEIVASVQQWLDAGSPGLSAPRKPEPPKRAELTDKERDD